MFKDYKKYLSTSIKVYLFVLVIVFILKIVGLNYFGIDTNNTIVLKISNIILKYKLDYIWYFISLYIYTYILLSMTFNDYSTKMKIYGLFVTGINYFNGYYTKNIVNNVLFSIILDLSVFIISVIIYEKRFNFKRIVKLFKISLLMILYEIISGIIRNGNLKIDYSNFVINFILNFDYILLMIITYKLYEGGVLLCGEAEAYSFSQKKQNLKKSLLKLRKNYQNNLKKFKKKDKVEKLTIIIYIFLSLIWNIFSVVLILLVARLNNTFVECIFILTSFWLSKRSFGKAFHFNSMLICFIVSNSTYYCLNRVTMPVGFSIIIPILLGVGLSYVTSKFVKKTYSPLYRGMPIDVFEETILKIVEKYSIKYKICYEFYINKTSDISLSFKYNYSISGIRKIRDRINEKIKKLN